VALITCFALLLLDATLVGYRAAAGRNPRVRKSRYHRQALGRGLLAGLLIDAVILGLARAVPVGDTGAIAGAMLQVFLPYAIAVTIAMLLWFSRSLDVRVLASVLVLGPFTLLRPVVVVAGIAWGWWQSPTPSGAALGLALILVMLRLESWLDPAPSKPRRWGLLLALPLAAWAGICAMLWALQGEILYPRPSLDAAALGQRARAAGAEELALVAADGTPLYGWFLPARAPEQGTMVFFSGNGSATGGHAGTVGWFRDEGWNVVHVNYRGYPGSAGEPDEGGLLLDAHAAWQYAQTRDPRPWIAGVSLGGGVAIGLASQVDARALLVQSSFTSVREVARERYGFLPVATLLRDHWDSAARAPRVACPVLLVHGDADRVVPYPHQSRLAAAFGRPVSSVGLPGRGHEDLIGEPTVQAAVRALLAGAPR